MLNYQFSIINYLLLMRLQNDAVNTHSTCVDVVSLLLTCDIGFNFQRNLWFFLVKAIAGYRELEVFCHLDIVHIVGMV